MNSFRFGSDTISITSEGDSRTYTVVVTDGVLLNALQELYSDYVRMRQLSAQVVKDRFTIPKKPEEGSYLLYDPSDETIIGENVPQAEVTERIRKYAEEDCEGFEDTFDVQVYKLVSTYECEPIRKVDVTLKINH